MIKQLEKLEEFQKAFDSTYSEVPTLLQEEDFKLRFKLLEEENKEYLEACKNKDQVEILDAITDQLYIVLGTAVSHGMHEVLEKAFDEVHRSNMSKLNEQGRPIINGINGHDSKKPFGKILKSDNFREPNLKRLLVCEYCGNKRPCEGVYSEGCFLI